MRIYIMINLVESSLPTSYLLGFMLVGGRVRVFESMNLSRDEYAHTHMSHIKSYIYILYL